MCGDLLMIYLNVFVDLIVILCGYVIVEENVFIGLYVVICVDEMDVDG